MTYFSRSVVGLSAVANGLQLATIDSSLIDGVVSTHHIRLGLFLQMARTTAAKALRDTLNTI